MINISAIITLVVAILISATVSELLPAGAEGARMFTALGITFVVGVIAEFIGLAPRLFYLMPLWMAALIMIGIQIYERHGVLGVLAVLAGGAALQALMIVVARFHERRRERKDLAERLRSVDLRHLNPAYDQAWDIVHEAVLVPRKTPWTRELLAHDHRVAALVERWLTDRHPGLPGADRLRRLVATFEEGAAAPDKAAVLGLVKESEWLQAMIRNRDNLVSDARRQ